MIEWGAFLVVAAASLIGACVLVTIAALGIRLLESGTLSRADDPHSGKAARAGARVLFVLCGLLVLFGVYLIVPILH